MSLQSQGPGWWMASDGRWYPPESHPGYRPASAQDPAPSRPPQPVRPAQGELGRWWRNRGRWTQLLILMTVIFCILAFIRGLAESDKPTEDGAFGACRGFVSDRLRAPATAKFRDLTSDGASADSTAENQFSVRASVDAENGFGALIRSSYRCEVTYLPDSDQWRLDDLWIEGQDD
jgi:hypothetical protein